MINIGQVFTLYFQYSQTIPWIKRELYQELILLGVTQRCHSCQDPTVRVATSYKATLSHFLYLNVDSLIPNKPGLNQDWTPRFPKQAKTRLSSKPQNIVAKEGCFSDAVFDTKYLSIPVVLQQFSDWYRSLQNSHNHLQGFASVL